MSDERKTEAPEEPKPKAERRPSIRGFARRILTGEESPVDDVEGLDPEERKRLEARAILAALLETGDKAKTETIRMVAREFRGYLEALELHKDLNHLLTNYSLEVKASIHLQPLHGERPPSEPGVGVGLKKREKDGEG
jgi:hypothetical protein